MQRRHICTGIHTCTCIYGLHAKLRKGSTEWRNLETRIARWGEECTGKFLSLPPCPTHPLLLSSGQVWLCPDLHLPSVLHNGSGRSPMAPVAVSAQLHWQGLPYHVTRLPQWPRAGNRAEGVCRPDGEHVTGKSARGEYRRFVGSLPYMYNSLMWARLLVLSPLK